MTLLRPLLKAAGFGTNSAPTTLTVRDDIIVSDRMLANVYGSIQLDTDYTATYEEIATRQLWVRIAVNKLAYAIGRLPLKTFERDGDERSRISSGALPTLMSAPNSTKETGHMPGFIARLAYDLFVYSNAIVVKVQSRPDAAPSELRPMSPRGWTIEESGDYVWRSWTSNRTERFKPWQIIHIVEPGPQHGGLGVSRLEAARLTLAIEYAAQRFGAATFRNGARPGGIINVKNLPTEPAQRAAAVERFKAEVMQRFGGVEKAGLPAVLEGDVDWTALSHNLNDSAVIEHRQLTREEVAALFDIPQPAIGILDEANFASVDLLHVMFYQDTLGWPVRLIESALNTQLVRGVPAFADQFLEFDLNAVMRGDIASRYRAYATAITSGFKTPNEVRALENDAPSDQPGADELHFPLNLSGAVGAQVAEDAEV